MRRAIIVGLFCSSLGFWAGQHGRAAGPERIEAMLVAARDIEPGRPLIPADLAVAARASEGFTFPPDGLRDVLGRSLGRSVRAGDALSGPLLPEVEAVPPKARAVTFDLPARHAWLHPRDRVDVLVSLREPEANELVTLTLLQNVVVAGVLPIDAGTLRVSVLVIPEEAEALMEATRLGTLAVTLRNPGDSEVMEERGRVTINTLLSGERTRGLMHHGCGHRVIEIIRSSGAR